MEIKLPKLNDGTCYLPIEFMRGEESRELFQSRESIKHFLSSGTTSSIRSLSHFSSHGLELYKKQSIKSFSEVLHFFFKEASTIKGISLIPSVRAWPSSSLAQMIHWFSEIWHVDYLDLEEFKKQDFSNESPLWIFASPLQLMELFDNGFCTVLPKGSILIETGGSKGRIREISRDGLYKLISTHLGLPEKAIVSEYGMCELASQAYDFVQEGQTRRFRFSKEIDISVLVGLGVRQKEGEGALLVSDPYRIDYPWPLRTQDIVRLYPDASFEILGRVPKSVLKGCSLLTESGWNHYTPKEEEGLEKQGKHRLPRIKRIEDLLDHPKTLAELAKEFHSESIARSALADIKQSLKNLDLHQALKNSQVQKEKILFLAPNNHSTALLYPLLLAHAVEADISIRLPKQFTNEVNFLHSLIEFFGASVFPNSFRIDKGQKLDNFDRLFLFGEDKTIHDVKRNSPIPISGFGSGISINIMTQSTAEKIKAIAKDMLSLAQRGCLSTRALFLYNIEIQDLDLLLDQLNQACLKFMKTSLTIKEQIALDHESIALYKNSVPFHGRKSLNDMLFPIYKNPQIHPSQFLSELPFVFPVFYYTNEDKLFEDLASFPSLLSISCDEETRKKLSPKFTALLGNCNAPGWDGYHNGKALFGS